MRSVLLRDNVNVAGLEFSEAAQELWHQWVRVLKAVRLCPQDDDGKSEARELLLVRQALVHREEDVVVGGVPDVAQEFAVFDTCPTSTRNCQDIVAGQISEQTFGQALVEQDSHLGRSEGKPLAGFLQERHGFFTADGRKILQKFIKRVAAF